MLHFSPCPSSTSTNPVAQFSLSHHTSEPTMHPTTATTLILALVATVASQDACLQDPTASSCSSFTYSGASSKLTSLCSQPSSKNLPACDWFTTACSSTPSSSAQCDAFSILNSACKDSSVPESNADCTEIRGLCKSGTVVTQCQKVITGLPDARNASATVASICGQMPDMTSCQPGCPPPSATTLVSDCNVLDVLSKACLEMPNMNQVRGRFQFHMFVSLLSGFRLIENSKLTRICVFVINSARPSTPSAQPTTRLGPVATLTPLRHPPLPLPPRPRATPVRLVHPPSLRHSSWELSLPLWPTVNCKHQACQIRVTSIIR